MVFKHIPFMSLDSTIIGKYFRGGELFSYNYTDRKEK